MKTSYKLLLLLFIFLGSACRKDEGNYNYIDINDLVISNINDSYIIKSGETLNIKPILSFSLDPNYSEDKYTFEWVSFKAGATRDNQRKSVNFTKNFDTPFPLGIGSYQMFYVIKEKSTGVSWQKEFRITVGGSYQGGWGVLSEVDGNSRLDYYEYEKSSLSYPKIYRDFSSLFTDPTTGKGIILKGKPKFLTGWHNTTPATGTSSKYFFYMGTEQSVEKINITDGFIWSERYAFSYETAGALALSKVDNITPVSAGVGYGVYDGDAYLRYAVFQYFFGTPVNRLNDNTYFKIAPFIAVSLNTTSPTALMYDITNKRFARNVSGSATSTASLAYDPLTAAFNPNNVGKDLVWMGQTVAYGGRAYAILKDANGYYLARMNNSATFLAYAWDNITALPDISKAENFAVDQIYGYLHYSVGGKLYQYDVDTKQTKLMKDYGSAKITVLKYNKGALYTYPNLISLTSLATYKPRFIPITTGLICATYDLANPNTSGKVDVFNVPQFNGDFTTYYSFSGFGKVADVCAAESPAGN